MLHSDKIPDINYSPDIRDIFYYFGINWKTLSPALFLLLGVLFGFFVLMLIKKFSYGDD